MQVKCIPSSSRKTVLAPFLSVSQEACLQATRPVSLITYEMELLCLNLLENELILRAIVKLNVIRKFVCVVIWELQT